jgi:hypothetical protein
VSLGSVAGVFSRYFIVGFFIPAFFAFVGLGHALSQGALPHAYTSAGPATQVAIAGGAAVLVGLVLLGLHYSILRLFEGYPLIAQSQRRYVRTVYGRLMDRQNRLYERACARTREAGASQAQRRDAFWWLDQTFPHDQDGLLLPTTFGNALRAFERHSRDRWGLNGIAAWPRIQMLLNAQEAQVHADAQGDVAFFVNGAILSALGGVALAADAILHGGLRWPLAWLYLLPYVLSWLLHRASIGAVIRWGTAVRASMDLHRLELYEKLGVRAPRDFTEERERIGPAVSAALLRGVLVPDDLFRTPTFSGNNGNDGKAQDTAAAAAEGGST